MWTQDQMNQYSEYLNLQEQAVIRALSHGWVDIEDVKDFVYLSVDGDIDHGFIESVYNTKVNPDRKVRLED
jgi:hypothetical protein